MDADINKSQMKQLTEKIIQCALTVSKTLGYKSSKKVYENALTKELRKAGLQVQHEITMHYEGEAIGEYTAGLLVEGVLLLELKTVSDLDDDHLFQCLSILRATKLRLCLLMNFAKPMLEVRLIENDYY